MTTSPKPTEQEIAAAVELLRAQGYRVQMVKTHHPAATVHKILRMHFDEGVPYSGISRALGMTRSAVAGVIARHRHLKGA